MRNKLTIPYRLLHRAWLTLWKPVPDLITILGVEVPEPPEVSLAGIKADAVTLHWAGPGHTKVVLKKYLIQVNGVNGNYTPHSSPPRHIANFRSAVGESSRLETAITVTGLKPGHFYNVRVIAVGNNNFQAGSRVIRLRTYNRDGRPDLGGRILNNLASDEAAGAVVDSSDESAGVRSHGVGIEAASMPEGLSALARDPSSRAGSRRNTGARKHSPSTASEQPPIPSNLPEGSMLQLTERFESIRGETEEVIGQVAKDAEEFKAQMAELIRERDEKRQLLKEKEDASERLKKEVHTSERLNRQAQTRKTQKEKALREREAERAKMNDEMKKWEKDIQEMQAERELWEKEKDKIASEATKKVDELKKILRKRQNSLNSMEEEIRVKGLQIKELEEERQKLPGAQDEEAKALEAADRLRDLQWDHTERELMTRYNAQSITVRNLETDLHKAQAHFQILSARQIANPLIPMGDSSGVAFDISGQSRPKRRNRQRKSRTNTISSPVDAYPITDSAFPSASVYNNMALNAAPSFAPGPYFDMSANSGTGTSPDHHQGMSEADIRSLTAGAPLSPTATSLLPSNIFIDDDPMEKPMRSLGPAQFPTLGPSIYEAEEQQSPGSSSHSDSLVSSPRNSQQNLRFSLQSQDSYPDSERRPNASRGSTGGAFGVIGSPTSESPQPVTKRFGDLFGFTGKQRAKTLSNDIGHPLGSLKPGQSQSFPRQEDVDAATAIKNRRTSFTSGWGGIPFLNRASTVSEITEGNAPAPNRNLPRRRRGFNMFGSSIDDPTLTDRDPTSPRPASIASSDLPRPSTDSAPFGWAPSDSNILTRNSPLATNWSLSVAQPWSRTPSRRPSIQYASTTQLTTGIATEDDDFLPPDTLSTASPPPVGVIGTRPASQMSATAKLNPAAPTFKAMFSRAKDSTHRPRHTGDEHEEHADDYPSSTSRASRDEYSIHTADSVAESYDSLEGALSNTALSEVASGSFGGSSVGRGENSFQKLLRKGSSSKFSISSFRGKEVGLFGKRGERNASADRSSSFGEGEEELALGGGVSVTSSPMPPTSAGAEKGDKEKGVEKGEKGTEKGVKGEGRMSVNWGRFGIKKKERGRVSEDMERASETDVTEDEGRGRS